VGLRDRVTYLQPFRYFIELIENPLEMVRPGGRFQNVFLMSKASLYRIAPTAREIFRFPATYSLLFF
jgi:hypothetical protein